MVIARSPGLHVSEFHASRGWPARARRRDITGKRGGKYIYQNGVEHNIIDIGGGHVACASNSRTRAIIIRRVRGLLKLTHEDPPPKPETDVWPFVIPETERNIHEIIWHCAATPEGRSIGENPAETIDRWHKERGWAGIGYHAVVDLDGKIYLGRDWNKIGAHVKGHNTGSLGFCYVGGVAKDGKTVKDTRTDAQRAAMLELTKMTIDKYPNIGRIAGHREYAPRGCPSFEMPEDKLGNIPGFLKGRKQ
ncbi:MAG: hypothetical protein GY761_03195 [Hyphomicrobiales bacterium]|nr:hypothetical protein [Hyphomicrobiales bacterium]